MIKLIGFAARDSKWAPHPCFKAFNWKVTPYHWSCRPVQSRIARNVSNRSKRSFFDAQKDLDVPAQTLKARRWKVQQPEHRKQYSPNDRLFEAELLFGVVQILLQPILRPHHEPHELTDPPHRRVAVDTQKMRREIFRDAQWEVGGAVRQAVDDGKNDHLVVLVSFFAWQKNEIVQLSMQQTPMQVTRNDSRSSTYLYVLLLFKRLNM